MQSGQRPREEKTRQEPAFDCGGDVFFLEWHRISSHRIEIRTIDGAPPSCLRTRAAVGLGRDVMQTSGTIAVHPDEA
jgi:hypothetical protein